MKRSILTALILFSTIIYGQSNYEIANVYFKKADENLNKIDYESAKINFEKGIKRLDSITRFQIAEIGTLIYYELKDYESAQFYAKQFFELAKNKNSETYLQMLDLFVEIEEQINRVREEEKRAELKRLKDEKEARKIDSLKTIWHTISQKFTIQADSISNFNKYGCAIFRTANKRGLIDHKGRIIIKASVYECAQEFDGFFIFSDKKKEASKIYCYNSKDNIGYELPDISEFDSNATFYDAIMLPRGNTKLVAYPNNSSNTIVYDLVQESCIQIEDLEEVLKALKKKDVIDKYDEKKKTIKIDKITYAFGNHLGGQVYTLYNLDTKILSGYLFTNSNFNEGHLLKTPQLKYLGYLYKNKMQAITEEGIVWYNSIGNKVSQPSSDSRDYDGEILIEKIGEKHYQLKKNGVVTMNGKTLEPLPDFLKKHQ